MFYLKLPPNKSGECLIYLKYNYHRIELKKSVSKRIRPDQWDPDRKLPKRNFKYYTEYKAYLTKVEESVRLAYERLTLTCIPSKEQLWTEAVKTMDIQKRQTVVGYAKAFTEDRIKSGKYKPHTLTIYNQVIEHLELFCPRDTIDQITPPWIEKFSTYLISLKKANGRPIAQNTARKLFIAFKVMINFAPEQGVQIDLKSKKSHIPARETTKVFLDEKELMQIYHTPMPTKEREAAKDAFIVAAFTGVRIGDLQKIRRESLKSIGDMQYFSFIAHKAEGLPDIPVHPLVLKILNHYDWIIPLPSRINFMVKKICAAAGINQIVNVTSWPGGKRKDEQLPKYTQVTAHTARRSLACNMYIAGVPIATIQKVLGHRDIKTTMIYLRLTPKEHLQIAYRSEFFKEKYY